MVTSGSGFWCDKQILPDLPVLISLFWRNYSYLDNPELEQYLYKLAKRQLLITLAQEGGHFAKANFHNDAYDPSSLDSLLGMEGNDVNNVRVYSADGNGTYKLETAFAVGYDLLKSSNIAEVVVYDQNGNIVPFYFDSDLQQFVFVISP